MVAASSPQGRFATGAELVDGRTLETTDAWGKHLFHRYSDRLWLHVHLGALREVPTAAAGAGPARGAAAAAADRGALGRPARADELRGHRPGAQGRITDALGPDPLRPSADPGLAARRIGRSRAAIAALLMNQAVVAGIGNVYRAEILFRHRIPPSLPGRELDPVVWADLWGDLITLMRSGVRSGRIVTTRPEDRERPSGPARRDDAFYVYRRTGLPCRVCGTPIATTVLLMRNLFSVSPLSGRTRRLKHLPSELTEYSPNPNRAGA